MQNNKSQATAILESLLENSSRRVNNLWSTKRIPVDVHELQQRTEQAEAERDYLITHNIENCSPGCPMFEHDCNFSWDNEGCRKAILTEVRAQVGKGEGNGME